MQVHRPAAVLVSAVIFAGGAVVAVNAVTTTDPVTLCSNNKSGAVTVPINGTCGKGTTALSVANDADVKTLTGRVDAVEPAMKGLDNRLDTQSNQLSSQGARIDALEAKMDKLAPGELTVTSTPETYGYHSLQIEGSELEPESAVRVEHEGGPEWFVGYVESDGTFAASWLVPCSDGAARVTATRESDWGAIATPWHTGADC